MSRPPAALKRPSWRRLASAAVLLLSAGFLAYKAYTGWDALRAYDWSIRTAYLLPSAGLFVVQFFVIVWGWRSIMNSLAEPLPFGQHARIYGYTHLLQRIPAGTLAMVAGRAHAYRKHAVSVRQSAIASTVELLLVVLTGLPLAALAAHLLGLLPLPLAAGLALACAALELGVLHPALFHRLLTRVRRDAAGVLPAYRQTLAWACVYTLVWIISGAGLFLIVRLFADVPSADLPRIVGTWVLSSLVAYATALSPSGLGVKELSLTVLLARLLPDPVPLLAALAIRVVWTVFDIVIGAAAWLL